MSPYQKSTEEDLLVSNNNDEKVVAVASQPALPFMKRVVAVVAAGGTAVVAILSVNGVNHSASVSPFSQASLMHSVNVNGLSSSSQDQRCSVPFGIQCEENQYVIIDGKKRCWSRCFTHQQWVKVGWGLIIEDFIPFNQPNCRHECPSLPGTPIKHSILCFDPYHNYL